MVVYGPDDVFDIPPGHDGYVVGDEPCVQIEWAGIRAFFAGFPTGIRQPSPRHAPLHRPRRLDGEGRRARRCAMAERSCPSTSTERASSSSAIGGREVNTTGDGLLATFDGPGAGAALRRGDPA